MKFEKIQFIKGSNLAEIKWIGEKWGMKGMFTKILDCENNAVYIYPLAHTIQTVQFTKLFLY